MDWIAVAIGVTSALAVGVAGFLAGVVFGRVTKDPAMDEGGSILRDQDLELIKQAVWFDVPLRVGDGPSRTPAYFLTRP